MYFFYKRKVIRIEGFNFGWPYNYDQYGVFWTNIPETKKIKNILLNVKNMSDKKLNDLYNNINAKNIMCYDKGNEIANIY